MIAAALQKDRSGAGDGFFFFGVLFFASTESQSLCCKSADVGDISTA